MAKRRRPPDPHLPPGDPSSSQPAAPGPSTPRRRRSEPAYHIPSTPPPGDSRRNRMKYLNRKTLQSQGFQITLYDEAMEFQMRGNARIARGKYHGFATYSMQDTMGMHRTTAPLLGSLILQMTAFSYPETTHLALSSTRLEAKSSADPSPNHPLHQEHP